jgi:hypothetical protein
MRTQKQNTGEAEDEKRLQKELHAIIGEQVLHILGAPCGSCRVKVHKLWKDNYRVNILTGPNVVSAVIAHSYFLVTDGEGNIVTSNPTITNQYQAPQQPVEKSVCAP